MYRLLLTELIHEACVLTKLRSAGLKCKAIVKEHSL